MWTPHSPLAQSHGKNVQTTPVQLLDCWDSIETVVNTKETLFETTM